MVVGSYQDVGVGVNDYAESLNAADDCCVFENDQREDGVGINSLNSQ